MAHPTSFDFALRNRSFREFPPSLTPQKRNVWITQAVLPSRFPRITRPLFRLNTHLRAEVSAMNFRQAFRRGWRTIKWTQITLKASALLLFSHANEEEITVRNIAPALPGKTGRGQNNKYNRRLIRQITTCKRTCGLSYSNFVFRSIVSSRSMYQAEKGENSNLYRYNYYTIRRWVS